MKNQLYIGTDIGGTTFTTGLFDSSGNLLKKSKKDLIENYKTSDFLISGITTQIETIISDKIINGIGISCPGPLNAKRGLILNTPNLKVLQNYNCFHLSSFCYVEPQ